MNHLWGGISILFEPNAAVFFWYKAGYPIWLAYILLSLPTSFTILLVFWGTGLLKKREKIRNYFSKVLSKLKAILPFWKKASNRHGQVHDKLVAALHKKGIIIVFIASCIPFLPIVPTASAIAVKLLEVRHGLLIIMLGTVIRNMLLVVGIYYGVSLFLPNN